MQTFYLLYKITNTIDGKHYIGVHKTTDINDSYMGSGKILKRAIKKHGVENFTKDVLAVFDTPEEMYQMESIVVDAEFVRRADTYNIKQGGHGGWDHINSTGLNVLPTEQRKEISKRVIADYRKRIGEEAFINSLRPGMFVVGHNRSGATTRFTGKTHKESSKQKIGMKNSISQLGSKNSQYGTCWVYNESGNKKINKDDLQQYLDAGYTKGRVTLVKH